jgi:hypothetical protein
MGIEARTKDRMSIGGFAIDEIRLEVQLKRESPYSSTLRRLGQCNG